MRRVTQNWAKHFGACGVHDVGYGITTGDAGNVYTTGSFKATLTATGFNVFAKKTDSMGNMIWSKKKIGSSTWGEGYAIIIGFFVKIFCF